MTESEAEPYPKRPDTEFEWPLSSVNTFGPVAHRLRHSALQRSPLANSYGGEPAPTQSPESFDHLDDSGINNLKIRTLREGAEHLNADSDSEARKGEGVQIRLDPAPDVIQAPHQVKIDQGHSGLRRDRSLRERLLEAQSQDPSASTEKFADIIGWNNSVPIEDQPVEHREVSRDETRRFSGISTTSTIEAFVFDQNPLPRRRTTLRHVSKHESLRSVSSPLPASNRNSMNSASDSPHRLVHKKAKLSNKNRWSFGSEISRSYSLASSAALPKTEIIRVAVIPERSSSLPSSASNSQRQSLSASSGKSHSRKTSDNPPSSWQHKRAFSESHDRGREQMQGPLIPPRSSSLSAPTSRTTSRANSMTSEHLQVRRQQAEKDLRKTLDRMESERMVNNLREWQPGDQVKLADEAGKMRHSRKSFGQPTGRTASLPVMFLGSPGEGADTASNAFGLAAPGSEEWAALRPPSLLETPFSQPSFQSASPEISEARAINYFPHNNHSLQLIEPFRVSESRAVQEVQKQTLPEKEIESPLRNPRRPPDPPQFQIIPPTPADENEQQLVQSASPTRRGAGSLRRPGGSRRRSESLMSSVSRNLSLKNARNRKADQDLDGNLHPFWRPRAFWDDVDGARADGLEEARSLERGIVNNSLGLPQERIVVTGPMSLVRRISERRRQRRGIVKQSSHGSLAKLRAGRRLHQLPGFGLQFHLVGIKDIQERILRAKQRKEDERREKRREDLRRSIGANVISTSDSRFPASNTNLSRDL